MKKEVRIYTSTYIEDWDELEVRERFIDKSKIDFSDLQDVCKSMTGKILEISKDPIGFPVYQTDSTITVKYNINFVWFVLHEIGHFLSASPKERQHPNLELTRDFSILGEELQMRRENEAYVFEQLVCLSTQGLNYRDVFNATVSRHLRELVSKFDDFQIEKVSGSLSNFFQKNPKVNRIVKNRGRSLLMELTAGMGR